METEESTWYQKLHDDCRPFVIFGDMEHFKPPERRATLQRVKAAKTAPRKWKEYGKVKTFFFTRPLTLLGVYGLIGNLILGSQLGIFFR